MEGTSPGDIITVMSTVTPMQVKDLSRRIERYKVNLLDAPVSGGYLGAEKGELTVMVGGQKCVFEESRDVLSAMGKDVFYLGPIGAGSTLKLVNQLLVTVNEVTVCEAMMLGVKGGINPEVVFDVITKSAGDSLMFRRRVPRMMNRDFTPHTQLDSFIKDLDMVLDTGKELNVPLVMGALAKEIYQMASCMGFGKEDDSAVVKVIEKIVGLEIKKQVRDNTNCC